jgi:hypothetical protein
MKTKQAVLEVAKEQAKEELSKMVDTYFANHEEAVGNKKLTIDKIEDFLLQARADAEEILKRAAREALETSESEMVEKKKSAPTVEKNL